VKINGLKHSLWRAVDHQGEVLESVVTKRHDQSAVLQVLGIPGAIDKREQTAG
jgi:putative transposase